MESTEKGATIRIGFRKYDKEIDNIYSDFKIPTYSLKIDKKSVLICGCAGRSDEYLEICENAAKDIAQIMNERHIKEYVIYNGERVKISTNAWVSCECMPKDGEKLFKDTLQDCLNGVQ